MNLLTSFQPPDFPIFGAKIYSMIYFVRQVASETINLLGFDEVRFVPCGARPDKKNFSTPQQRLEMTRAAVDDFFPPDFPIEVDPIEVENGPSIPTALLMDQLQDRYR